MKKILIVLLLLLIIAVSFSFVALKWSFDREDSYISQNWRQDFAANPLSRQIFALHYDGDARADYLGSRYDNILIEVDLMTGYQIDQSVLESFGNKLGLVTGKTVDFLISDRDIPLQDQVTSSDIDEISNTFELHSSNSKSAHLYLLVLSQSAESESVLGVTHQDDGIVIFADSLESFSRTNPANYQSYTLSTALHEFGHQLGLPHNDLEGCLMNVAVDEGEVWRFDPEDVVTDFCEYEVRQLESIKSSI